MDLLKQFARDFLEEAVTIVRVVTETPMRIDRYGPMEACPRVLCMTKSLFDAVIYDEDVVEHNFEPEWLQFAGIVIIVAMKAGVTVENLLQSLRVFTQVDLQDVCVLRGSFHQVTPPLTGFRLPSWPAFIAP